MGMRDIRGYLTLLAVVLCGAVAASRPAAAETRVALVIGNGAYRHAPTLPNPANDAGDVAASLKRLGFDTIVATDLDKAGMDDATIRFARAARTADVAMFYYSGHALQFAGVNYLAPIDAQLSDEADLRRMVRVDEIVADLQQAKTLRILVLDSCRNNPLAEELKRSIGATRALGLSRGLARLDAPEGMIVAYATQSGREALDGSDRNSPYTRAFLKEIEVQDEIGSIFRQVSADVYETTQHTQLPELSLSVIGKFYLHGAPEIAPKPADTAPQDFQAAQSVDSVTAWDAFLKQHPEGFYATLAQERRATSAAKLAAAQRAATSQVASADTKPQVVDKQAASASPPKATDTGTRIAALPPAPGQALAPPATAEGATVAAAREKYRRWTIAPRAPVKAAMAIAVSPDGARVVAGGADHTVRIWDTATGRLLRAIDSEIQSGLFSAVAISPDNRRVLGVVDTGPREQLLAWDVATGHLLHKGDAGAAPNKLGSLPHISVSPDGSSVVANGFLTTARVSALETGQAVPTDLPGALFAVMSPDGKQLVSGGCDDKEIAIWNVATLGYLRSFYGVDKCAINLTISADGKRVTFVEAAKADLQGSGPPGHATIKVWDLPSGEAVRSFDVKGLPFDLAVAPNSARLDSTRLAATVVAADGDKSAHARLQMFDAATGEVLRTLRDDRFDPSDPSHIAFPWLGMSPDGKYLIANDAAGNVVCHAFDTGAVLWTGYGLDAAGAAVVRADGSFWTDADGLAKLQLVRNGEQQPIPDDYKAAFLREQPFDAAAGVASK